MTGSPHEFGTADSTSYIEVAQDWAIYINEDRFWSVLGESLEHSFSDTGYPLVITPIIYLFGVDLGIFMILIANAFLGAYTSVIVYRIARRSMSETTARLAAIFCMLHPVLINYVGMTLKEVLMTLLVVLFIDMADRMLRNRKYTFATIAPMALIGLMLFMFRTVLGMVAFIAVFFALVMMDTRIVSWGRKMVLGLVLVGLIFAGASDNIMREVNQIRDTDVMEQQQISMTQRDFYTSIPYYGCGRRSRRYAIDSWRKLDAKYYVRICDFRHVSLAFYRRLAAIYIAFGDDVGIFANAYIHPVCTLAAIPYPSYAIRDDVCRLCDYEYAEET